ncbi:hypothetical protein SAMN02745121_01602 [Nannocystis exedens]|uniref:Lipoprotein n=1 Tax=Nannocystis exedens TaxID=54 RepID=A0A1I1V7B8_9BACT|nr:hypothetical protein [Nannocystis exedens]PCC72425.1 hypothetical protein NAEX_05505 [Nannocystis exedens]SFD78896.1 hypothetical protein SAMN02745121_01602 [Nannocystis exedens]
MSKVVGGLMGSTVVAWLVAGGCAPPESQPGQDRPDSMVNFVVAGRPLETDDGLYLLEFSPFPGSNFAWPTTPGRTRIALDVRTGPGFVVDDDDAAVDETAAAEMPIYPLMLTFDAVVPPASAIGQTFYPEAWPTNADGTQWTLELGFPAPGDWTLPITVADSDGRVDRVRATFRLVAPDQGRPARAPG